MDIILENITKSYEKEILKNFSITFSGNKTTAIMGKSGCGKTTIFNIICGFIKQDEGNLKISDNYTISAVFQENRLFKTFTGRENLLAITSDTQKIDNALKICEAEDFSDIKVKKMSGGMARRIAIARCLSIDADIYIMDEPFRGIDISTKNRILLKLKQYLKGKCCIVITHDINEAVNISDNIVVLGKSPVEIVFKKENLGSDCSTQEELENVLKNL